MERLDLRKDFVGLEGDTWKGAVYMGSLKCVPQAGVRVSVRANGILLPSRILILIAALSPQFALIACRMQDKFFSTQRIPVFLDFWFGEQAASCSIMNGLLPEEA